MSSSCLKSVTIKVNSRLFGTVNKIPQDLTPAHLFLDVFSHHCPLRALLTVLNCEQFLNVRVFSVLLLCTLLPLPIWNCCHSSAFSSDVPFTGKSVAFHFVLHIPSLGTLSLYLSLHCFVISPFSCLSAPGLQNLWVLGWCFNFVFPGLNIQSIQ